MKMNQALIQNQYSSRYQYLINCARDLHRFAQELEIKGDASLGKFTRSIVIRLEKEMELLNPRSKETSMSKPYVLMLINKVHPDAMPEVLEFANESDCREFAEKFIQENPEFEAKRGIKVEDV